MLSGWDDRKRLTIVISGALVDATLTNFPFLLTLGTASGVSAADVSVVFAELGSSSLKIAVEVGDTGTQCYVEIERWNDEQQQAQLWVRIPSLTSGGLTLYLYADAAHSDNTDYVGITGSTAAKAVWDSSYRAVYHCSQDPATGGACILDSTNNALHATPSGSMTSADLVAGPAGSLCLDFDGTDDLVTSPNAGISGGSFTLSCLAMATSLTANDCMVSAGTGNYAAVSFFQAAAATQIATSYPNTGTTTYTIPSAGNITSSWTGLSYRYAPSTENIVINGVSVASRTYGITFANAPLRMGGSPGGDGAQFAATRLRDVRISNINRSVAWEKATYNSLLDLMATYTAFERILSVVITIDQQWGVRLGSVISERWSVADNPSNIFNQPYSSATKQFTRLSQLYSSSYVVRKIFENNYNFLSDITSVLLSQYISTSVAVSNFLQDLYSIKITNQIISNIEQTYLVTGNISLKTLQTQHISIEGEIIYPCTVELKSSIDQYSITASIEVISHDEMKKFVPGTEVILHNILSTNFTLIVDVYDYDISFDSDTFKVDLLSPAALLDSPFANLINGDYTGMASEICKTLAGSITVNWDIIDWYIGEGVLSASEETPLSVIRKIVNAVGGVIQSLPDGSITVLSRYPKSCNIWTTQIPVYSINYSEDVISEQFTLENAPGYNNFSIQDDGISSTLLRVEVEEIDSNSKTIKVFVYPDVVPAVSHSGNTGTVSLNYTGYIIENLEKEVEFVSGESSVEGPINGINYSSWKYTDLGAITYEPTGVLYSSIIGESLLDISYKTGYYSYTVSTSVLENIQIIVEADV